MKLEAGKWYVSEFGCIVRVKRCDSTSDIRYPIVGDFWSGNDLKWYDESWTDDGKLFSHRTDSPLDIVRPATLADIPDGMDPPEYLRVERLVIDNKETVITPEMLKNLHDMRRYSTPPAAPSCECGLKHERHGFHSHWCPMWTDWRDVSMKAETEVPPDYKTESDRKVLPW